jgi:hypothetical protein
VITTDVQKTGGGRKSGVASRVDSSRAESDVMQLRYQARYLSAVGTKGNSPAAYQTPHRPATRQTSIALRMHPIAHPFRTQDHRGALPFPTAAL